MPTFRDPKPQLAGVPPSKVENPTGTQDQDILDPVEAPTIKLESPLEHALARLGAMTRQRLLLKAS
jgi:hypothetical protein